MLSCTFVAQLIDENNANEMYFSVFIDGNFGGQFYMSPYENVNTFWTVIDMVQNQPISAGSHKVAVMATGSQVALMASGSFSCFVMH